ncbi:MAG: hypothetical protein OHK0013_01580 [Sandaracinaceae bacterium]
MSYDFDPSDDCFAPSELHELFGLAALHPDREGRPRPVDLQMRTSASTHRRLGDFRRDPVCAFEDDLDDGEDDA